MSNTKIVIDKEQIDKIYSLQKDHAYFQGDNWTVLKRILDTATEIRIDQSIEERAEKEYPDVNCEDISQQKITDSFNRAKRKHFIKGATSKQIIEKLRVKEKDKECKHCGKIRNKHTVIGMCLDRMKHFEI